MMNPLSMVSIYSCLEEDFMVHFQNKMLQFLWNRLSLISSSRQSTKWGKSHQPNKYRIPRCNAHHHGIKTMTLLNYDSIYKIQMMALWNYDRIFKIAPTTYVTPNDPTFDTQSETVPPLSLATQTHPTKNTSNFDCSPQTVIVTVPQPPVTLYRRDSCPTSGHTIVGRAPGPGGQSMCMDRPKYTVGL